MIKVAICQCGSLGTASENLENMVRLFKKAMEGNINVDVVTFPEYCYYSPLDINESRQVAIDLDQPHIFLDTMKALAKEYHVNLIPGSFVTRADDGRVKNTIVFINRDGEIIARYDKIHLMVAASYDESAYVSPGSQMCVFDSDLGRIGMMVCYDLRFPEQARSMCLDGAKVLFVSSMFPAGAPLPTRVDDWDILVKSTALTNMTYVVATNQFGSVHGENSFGRSCLVDPKGLAEAFAGGRECIVYGEIDLEYQAALQENLGVWRNRRPDVYRV
ncbi:MAG: nitrilase-related carbon-nitrogen hydrolase [Lawsonibacter sp.]|nr:nitrilase-related carbon-nitrogen hydrolase [Lawsonibacter sp.]